MTLRDSDNRVAPPLHPHSPSHADVVAVTHSGALRKGGTVTRSFGSRVTQKVEMEQAIAGYAARLADKLRRHD